MTDVMKAINLAEKAVVPDKTPLEEIELLNACQAEKLCHIGRSILYAAMDKFKASKGQLGLAFVVHDGSSRRLIRRASLRRWLEGLERRAIYA
jgi:hypothetical protein